MNVRYSPRFYGPHLKFSSQTCSKRRWFSAASNGENLSAKKRWRELFEEIGKKNGLTQTDWYRADPKSVLDSTCTNIVSQHFNSSIYAALASIFPETKWHPWKFQHQNAPQNYWKEQSHQKLFFDDLGKEIGIQQMDDWYQKLNNKLLTAHGGIGLLAQYNNSAFEALKTTYREHEWIPWKFSSVNRGFWKSIENQRQFFNWLGNKLGVKELDDWYTLASAKKILDHGGSFLIHYYKGSPSEALRAVYPEHNWKNEKFSRISHGCWASIDKQREFFDELAKKLNIATLDGWYTAANFRTVMENGGSFLTQYDSSVTLALMKVYPEHNWIPWKFQIVPRGFWKSVENQRKFFDWLGKQSRVNELDDWYKILSQKLVQDKGGTGLISFYYKGSAIDALMAAYPEHNWIPWKFSVARHGYWANVENVGKLLASLSEKLSIQTLDDWYRVDMLQLYKFSAANVVKKHGGLYAVLKKVYPHHPWDKRKFQVNKKAQRWLVVNLKKLFPESGGWPLHPFNLYTEIMEDYIHPNAMYPGTVRPIQLDAFIPSLSMAFEYQGQQHFQQIGFFQPQAIYQRRDNLKRKLCSDNNIKLIEIPYWWDRTTEGLQDMIKKAQASSQ